MIPPVNTVIAIILPTSWYHFESNPKYLSSLTIVIGSFYVNREFNPRKLAIKREKLMLKNSITNICRNPLEVVSIVVSSFCTFESCLNTKAMIPLKTITEMAENTLRTTLKSEI